MHCNISFPYRKVIISSAVPGIHLKREILNYPLGNYLINFIHTFRIVLINFKSSPGKKKKKIKIIPRGKKKMGEGGEEGRRHKSRLLMELLLKS